VNGKRFIVSSAELHKMSDQPLPRLEPLAVDADDAAAMLSMSRSAFYAAWSAGLVPNGGKIGRQRRWSVVELRAWLAAGMPPRSEWRARQCQIASRERVQRMVS
jgi:predicted DNA-binding transcriptional regulator AlpA